MDEAEPRASLPEVFRSVAVPSGGAGWRKWLAFTGPAFLVSVGYMDPGNWGTDLEGGSKFGYTLLWVVLASSLMAQFLQVLCVRHGLVLGQDLAQTCRSSFKKPVVIALWLLAEVAIVACDLAEVVGSAVALNLLFGLPLLVGVVLTGLDVLLLLGFMKFGFRKIEAVVLVLVLTVFGCFVYETFLSSPDWGRVLAGTVTPMFPNHESIFIALGILGATVMPHNLYLHSSIVQTRRLAVGKPGLDEALRYNTLDTVGALGLAFFVNAAILVVAAAVFHRTGTEVTELQQGQQLLRTALGASSALVFSVALLASGQSSTITGTLAGQVVMEGFMDWHIAPWARRLITRCLAIVPAAFIIQASGGKDTVQLLVLSQVVLSMQLPFAVIPLVMFTSSRAKMGGYVNPSLVKAAGYLMGALITGLNLYLLDTEVGHIWLAGGCLVVAAYAAYCKFLWKPRSAAA